MPSTLAGRPCHCAAVVIKGWVDDEHLLAIGRVVVAAVVTATTPRQSQ